MSSLVWRICVSQLIRNHATGGGGGVGSVSVGHVQRHWLIAGKLSRKVSQLGGLAAEIWPKLC
jgi:hypothetical protein